MSYSPTTQAKRRHALATSVAISLWSGSAAVAATDYTAPTRVNAGEQRVFAAGDSITQSGNGYALVVSGHGALASGDGLALRITGQQAGGAGIHAADGGHVVLSHAAIDTASMARFPSDTIWATGIGSLVQLDAANIQAGRNANGGGAFNADGGARIVFNDGTVTAGRVGDTFHLLTVSGAGSTMELNRTRMHVSGTASLTVGSQAKVELNAAVLSGHEGVLGLNISGAGAQLDATTVKLINARYYISHGGNVRLQDSAVENAEGNVFMLLGSTGAMAGAEVQGGTFAARGDYVLNANNHSRFVGKNLRLLSKDAEAAIWVATDTSILVLDNARIETSGRTGDGSGIHASGGTTTLRGSTIDTHADKAFAVRATGSTSSSFNRLRIEDSRLHTWGAGGAGVLLGGGTVDAQVSKVHVTTEGAASPGILQINTAKLTVTDSTVLTHGANSAAFRSYLTKEGDHWGNASFAGGELRTSDGAALWLQGANHALSLQGSEVSAGSATGGLGLLLRVSDTLLSDGRSVRTDQIRFNASAAKLNGNVQVTSGTATTRLHFSDGTQFTGALLGSNGLHVSDMQLMDRSIWHMTAASELQALTHQGTVAFLAPATADDFKQLQISGDYTGMGGRFVLNTALSGDQSRTDKVHIAGDSAGTASLHIVNAAGSGAVARRGIQVVQVDGRSHARVTLDGRVVAGAYEYLLYQGSQETPDDGDWYLRSERRGTPDDPVLRPEVGVYQTNQLLAAHMFDHSLHDRLGLAEAGERQREERSGQVWIRAVRNQLQLPSGRHGLAIDSDIDLLQLDAELRHWNRDHGRFQVGVMGGLARAQTHVGTVVTGYQAKGQVLGHSLGIYGTWFARADQATGLYVDTWLQYGSYEDQVRGGYLQPESYSARTWSGSIETGYSWQLHTGERVAAFVQPQLQLLYTDYHAGCHVEANGTRVQATQAAGLTTRLSARVFGHAGDSGARRVQPFLSLNWEHRVNDNIVAFNGVEMKQNLPRNLYAAQLGAEAILGGGWMGWGHMAIQRGAGGYRDVEGQLSVGYRW